MKAAVAFNALGEAAGSMTAAIGDCNGDMVPDILVSRLGYGSLYMGTRQKVYDDRMMSSGLGALTAQYVGWGSNFLDYDNDGRPDVLVTTMGDRPFLLHNRSKSGNHWLCLDLEGTKSNRDGFGARITLTAGGRSRFSEARCPAGFLGQSDRRVHFGLGANQAADQIEIRWPSGIVQMLKNVSADQVLKVREAAQ